MPFVALFCFVIVLSWGFLFSFELGLVYSLKIFIGVSLNIYIYIYILSMCVCFMLWLLECLVPCFLVCGYFFFFWSHYYVNVCAFAWILILFLLVHFIMKGFRECIVNVSLFSLSCH